MDNVLSAKVLLVLGSDSRVVSDREREREPVLTPRCGKRFDEDSRNTTPSA